MRMKIEVRGRADGDRERHEQFPKGLGASAKVSDHGHARGYARLLRPLASVHMLTCRHQMQPPLPLGAGQLGVAFSSVSPSITMPTPASCG